MDIYRYDDCEFSNSDLDPIEDLTNLFSVLKSKGFVSDLLAKKHGFTSRTAIEKASKKIGLHIDVALELAKQGVEGRTEISFLPLYYSFLNIIKAYIIVKGKGHELDANGWHGSTYDHRQMSKRNLLKQEITIKTSGAIPLFYKVMFGHPIPRQVRLTLEHLYSNINSIEAEYTTFVGSNSLWGHVAEIKQDDANGHFLQLRSMFQGSRVIKPSMLHGYPAVRSIESGAGREILESARIHGRFDDVVAAFKRQINRNCISNDFNEQTRSWYSLIPIGKTPIPLNEDICILLAFFHLSNVVRYNPEHLKKIFDSKYCSIVLALGKHGFFRFQKLMWGNINAQCFSIK